MISIGERAWFFIGHDMLRDRPTISFCWGYRDDAEEGESVYRHQWAISWPLFEFLQYQDEAGRVWPCGIWIGRRVFQWVWHLPA